MTEICKSITGTAPYVAPANIQPSDLMVYIGPAYNVETYSAVVPWNARIIALWKNNGGSGGSFTPKISVGGVVTTFPVVYVGPGITVTRTLDYTVTTSGSIQVCHA